MTDLPEHFVFLSLVLKISFRFLLDHNVKQAKNFLKFKMGKLQST